MNLCRALRISRNLDPSKQWRGIPWDDQEIRSEKAKLSSMCLEEQIENLYEAMQDEVNTRDPSLWQHFI